MIYMNGIAKFPWELYFREVYSSAFTLSYLLMISLMQRIKLKVFKALPGLLL